MCLFHKYKPEEMLNIGDVLLVKSRCTKCRKFIVRGYIAGTDALNVEMTGLDFERMKEMLQYNTEQERKSNA